MNDPVVYQWDAWEPGEADIEAYNRSQHEVFLRDKRIILCAEKDIFTSQRYPDGASIKNVLSGLYFVELTILEQRLVHGDYQPKNNHFGYRAKGSDGWFYTCQWDRFDDCSMNPYNNWHREFIEGTHYTLGEDKSINNWLIPRSEFDGHYINWRLDNCLGRWAVSHRQGIVDYVNNLFPNTQLKMCHKQGKRDDGTTYHHSQNGAEYAGDECFYCKHMPKQIIGD
jgi:hypothetical protein